MKTLLANLSARRVLFVAVPLILLGWLVHIWPTTRGTSRARLTIALPAFRNIYPLTALAYSPDGKTIAGMSEGRSWLFDADSGELKGSYQNGAGDFLSWSRDKRKIVAADSDLWIWDIAHPEKSFAQSLPMGGSKKITRFGTESDQFCTVSPDAALAGCALNHELNDKPWKDDSIAVWEVATKKKVFQFPYNPAADGSKRRICGLAFSADNTKLAFASLQMMFVPQKTTVDSIIKSGAKVTLLDARTGKTTASFVWPNLQLWMTGYVNGSANQLALAFSPDGQCLAGADSSSICLWDIKSGQLLQRMEIQKSARMGGFRRILFSPDNQLIAGFWSQNIEVWDAKSGKRWRIFHPIGDCHVLAFSPDSQTLASGSNDRQSYLQLWNVGH